MRQSELRQKLFDFFEENEIDYDQSQNTLNLYRWAIRNHKFEPIEEIEQLIEEKKKAKKDKEKDQIEAEKEQEKREDEEKEKAEIEANKKTESERKEQEKETKEEKKDKKVKKEVEPDPVKAEIIKEKEDIKEEQKKNDWIFYLLILAFLAYLLFNFLKNRENGTEDEPGK